MNLGKQLHKLGAIAFNHPWRFISAWVVVLAIFGVSAMQFMKAPSSSLSIPGTPAQASIDRIKQLFPSSGGGTGRIVFETTKGTIADYKSSIDNLITKIADVDGVSQAVSPFIDESFVSKGKTIAYAQIQFDEQTGSISDTTLADIQALVNDTRSSNLHIESGGDLVSNAPGEIIGIGELAGVAIALLVLVMTLGSLISGGMPIASALLAVGVSMAGLFAMSQLFEINSTTPVLAVMLGLAVGIDYSLFIVNKHRMLALSGLSFKEAAARSLGTAGNAVVFAAVTVIIALAALSVVNIPFMTTMGLVGAASIAIAAAVSLTITPALLGLAGDKVLSKKQRRQLQTTTPKSKASKDSHHTFWYRWGKVVTASPVISLIISVVVIGAIALPVKDLSLGLPSDQYASAESTEHKAYSLLTKGFGVGFNAPLTVVVEGMPNVSEADKDKVRQAAMSKYNAKVAEATEAQEAAFNQQLANATTPAQLLALQQAAADAQQKGQAQQEAALAEIEKNVATYAKYVQLNTIADKIKDLSNVERVQPSLVTDNGDAGIIQVIPKTAPAAQETKDLITSLRSESTKAKLTDNSSVSIGVTGAAALQEDINQKLANALPMYLGIIVGLSLLLLLVAFRSILVPVKATLGYILSVLAMFGAIVAVFQWGWFGITDAAGPIVSFIPIIAAGILFGLAMDYEFFLVSGMHESYTKTKDAHKSVIEGFGAGAKVVTAAAVIMISVFAGFISNHETVIQSIGFGLAVGILVDAFLVRMMLVPAVMTLLGKSAWWLPKWLDKRLPHISIEGEAEK
jgi:RND superfamily putative drug exporter